MDARCAFRRAISARPAAAVKLVAAEQLSAQEGGGNLVEKEGPENRDCAGVLVAAVQVKAAGENERARAVTGLGEDEQVGRAGGFLADVDETVVTRFERLRVVGQVGGDVGALLGIDEAVLGIDAGGAVELRDVAIETEDPAGQAEFLVVNVDPEAGVLDVTAEAVGDHDVAVGGQHLGEDGVGFPAERTPRGAVEMPVEILEGLEDHAGAQRAHGLGGVGRQGGGVERGAEKLPPLRAVMVVEGQLLRAAPHLDLLDEAGAQRGERAVEGLLDVGPVEAVEAEVNPFVHPGAQVDAAALARIEPPRDLDPRDRGPPAGRTVDVEEGGRRSGHAKGRN